MVVSLPSRAGASARGLAFVRRHVQESAWWALKRWSPAEIAARLVIDHPDDEAMRVSHETIYASLYLQGRGGLKKELIAALRWGRLRRRPRRRGENAKRANVLGDIEPISSRPPDRAIPGHWEGDLIMGLQPVGHRDRGRAPLPVPAAR